MKLNKIKRLVLLIFSFLPVASFAAGQWRMHTSFADVVSRVIETPGNVYFLTANTPASNKNDLTYSLFKYDKEGDELLPLSVDNLLSYPTISDIEYNPQKNYLLVLYSNSDIDLIYENGDVVNIPALRLAQMSSSKKVNDISIDPWNDRVYLATDFGYIAINDKKGEIAESRNYSRVLNGTARIGDNIIVFDGNKLLTAKASSSRLSIDEYEELREFENPRGFFPVDSDRVIILSEDGSSGMLTLMKSSGRGNFDFEEINRDFYYNIENNKNGISVATTTGLSQYGRDGFIKSSGRPEDLYRTGVGTYDFREIWHGKMGYGLTSGKPVDGNWVVTRDFMEPDSPGVFFSSAMALHPSIGLLVASNGADIHFNGGTYNYSGPQVFSAYQNGRWKNYSPCITNPEQRDAFSAPHGMAVDPNDNKYVYLVSNTNGLIRINITDPKDILHLSGKKDSGADLPGFVEFLPDRLNDTYKIYYMAPPQFDYYGNMWTTFSDIDRQEIPHITLYCWQAADRKNSTDASSVILPTKIDIPGYRTSNLEGLLPLKTSGKRNVIVYKSNKYYETLLVIDTNGTPLDPSDDTVKAVENFFDQDGNSIDVHYIRALYEDPSTGYVWAGHSEGVFYFNPSDILNGKPVMYRVKVSRNDGTNLADYLLNGVGVNQIVADGSGRKWFATEGGGLVCTSSDGREILEEVNTSNSRIPDDMVFTMEYYPSNNSLMVSTNEGLAEYFLSGVSSDNSSGNDLKVYPNPVRPDYLGYVTIEGLPSGSLVKIADAAGHVVKELGICSGSDAQWDVTNASFKRVNSGVYYILASPAGESQESAIVGKVLVVN